MKQFKLLSVIIILTSLFSCEPPVTFTEPQPIDTDNLSKFPNRLQGHYLSLSDSSTLIISDHLIERTNDFDYKFHPNQLDSTARISGDTLIYIQTSERALIKRNGDSLMIHIHNVDTLFQMDYDNVVRKFKGYYFLNTRYDKTSWAVEKMQLSKGQLVISNISTEQEIENLKEITETAQHLTQQELAEKVGTTKNYNSRIENNASDIKLSTSMRIIREGLGGSLKFSLDV